MKKDSYMCMYPGEMSSCAVRELCRTCLVSVISPKGIGLAFPLQQVGFTGGTYNTLLFFEGKGEKNESYRFLLHHVFL